MFHCIKTNNVHKTRFKREITRFSAFNVVFAEYAENALAHLTSFLLNTALKHEEMLVLALVSLTLRLRLQCVYNAFARFPVVSLL